jgi:hypothetical protein
MNAKLLMYASAFFMAILGIGASFFPQEILVYCGAQPQGPGVLLVQITGALYMGFAILNWMARGNLIGGIYSRPVALGNFLHFAVVTVVLLKALTAGQYTPEIVVAATVYSAFGLWFGFVLFTSPIKKGDHFHDSQENRNGTRQEDRSRRA